jgi:hypothetical protein
MMRNPLVQVLGFVAVMALLVAVVRWMNRRPPKSAEEILAETRADFYGKNRADHACCAGSAAATDAAPSDGPSEFSSLTDD